MSSRLSIGTAPIFSPFFNRHSQDDRWHAVAKEGEMESPLRPPEESHDPTHNVPVAVSPAENAHVTLANGTGSATPTALIPAVMERSAFEYHLEECRREFQPVGYLEFMVVRDIARHVVAMETWNEGVGALQRQRAQRLPAIIPEGDDGELEDVSLAAAVSAPEVHLGEQHGQRRSRAFHRAVRTLLDLQARRKNREAGGELIAPPNHFPTEAACEDHLRKRFEQGCSPCPRCGCRRGHYISARRSWECGQCKRQTGLRANTVAADSPLPLVTWFTAIHLLLCNPTIGTTELGIKLGISRSTTVRGMAKKIIAAMAAGNSSESLAGLDIYYACCPAEPPESGALEDTNAVPGAEGS
jgi:hypothetical protein